MQELAGEAMSGGPVIDEAGYVVGVTVAKIIGLGQSLAILTEHVRDLCAKYGVTIELKQPPPKKMLRGMPSISVPKGISIYSTEGGTVIPR